MGGEEITEKIAKEAMRLAQYKLPVKTKFISTNEPLNNSDEVKSETSKVIDKEVKS